MIRRSKHANGYAAIALVNKIARMAWAMMGIGSRWYEAAELAVVAGQPRPTLIDPTMILVTYRHGLRASEVCDLQWHQVELDHGRMHVRRAQGRQDAFFTASSHAAACGYKLANDGHDTRALQHYLGHKNIQHTVRYTELSPDRFRDFWRD
jgi:site-specific recombinase XerD